MAVSVNLSPHQFTDTTLVADVAGILAETNLPASQLTSTFHEWSGDTGR